MVTYYLLIIQYDNSIGNNNNKVHELYALFLKFLFSNILKKAQGWKFEKERIQFIDFIIYFMGLIMRKPVFGAVDQVRLKPVCSDSEMSYNIETLLVASVAFIHSREW